MQKYLIHPDESAYGRWIIEAEPLAHSRNVNVTKGPSWLIGELPVNKLVPYSGDLTARELSVDEHSALCEQEGVKPTLQSWHALTRLSYPDSFAASSAPVSENLSASGDRKIIELKTLAENTLKKRGYQLRQAATHFDSIYFITQFRPDEEQIAQQGLKELLTCVLDKGNFDEQTLSEWNFDKKVFDPLGYMDFYKSEFAMVAFLTWNGEMDPAKIMFTKGGREIEKSIRAKMTELEKGPYF